MSEEEFVEPGLAEGLPDWEFPGGNAKLEMVCIDGVLLVPGDRVRLCPKGRADAFDLMLAGRVAVIEGIEQDYEERIYLSVVVDDDPGKEFGMQRKPGHRFFYSPDEVELVAPAAPVAPVVGEGDEP